MNNEILRFVHIYLEPVLKIAKSLFKKVSYILESNISRSNNWIVRQPLKLTIWDRTPASKPQRPTP